MLKNCRDPGSNRGPLDLQSNALPTELSRLAAVRSEIILLVLGQGFMYFFWTKRRLSLSWKVADPHHFNADPDLDTGSHQSDANLRPLVYRTSRAAFLASTPRFVSVYGPPKAPFWASTKLLNFDFNADPDQAFLSNADPASKNSADPCGCVSGSQTLLIISRHSSQLSTYNAAPFCFDVSRWGCDHIPVHGARSEKLQRAYRSLQPRHQQPSPRQHLGKTLSYQLAFRN